MATTYGMLSKKLLASVLICMVVAPLTKADITCDTVDTSLRPCLTYILFGGSVPADCCSGLKSLIASATTTADRQSACGCIKSIASTATGEELTRAAGLPGQCGVTVPFQISPDVDCSKVQL